MEERLHQAARALPEPRSDFLSMEELAKKAEKVPGINRKKRLVILALALCLCITACAYSSTKYGLWGGYSSYSFSDVKHWAKEFDYTFPETMNGSPFVSVSTAHGAPQGYSRLQALLMPTYKIISVSYSIEKEEVREDGVTYGWSENSVNISFGTTEKEQWKYHFSVAEDGSCNYSGVEPGSNRTAEYEGYTLYLYTIGESHSVRWEDPERKMVIVMHCYDLESQEDAVEIAKELIDLNLYKFLLK